jgi:hypothetical protein
MNHCSDNMMSSPAQDSLALSLLPALLLLPLCG